MKNSTRIFTGLFAAGAFAILVLGSLEAFPGIAQGQIPSQPLRPEPPRSCLQSLDDYVGFPMLTQGDSPQETEVHLSLDSWGRSVRLEFSYTEGIRPHYNRASDAIDYPTSFYPTAAIHAGSDRIVVAGKDAVSGQAIIELWSFSRPSLFRIPDASGGPDRLFLRAGKVSKIDTVFAPSASTQFGLVRAMWRNRALGGDHVFIMSHQGNDIYSLDFATKAALLVVSDSVGVAGMPAIPPLNDGWLGFSGPYRHSDLGDVYKLRKKPFLLTGIPGVFDLLLVDADKNGSLDYFELVSEQNEVSLGLVDMAKWEINWWD